MQRHLLLTLALVTVLAQDDPTALYIGLDMQIQDNVGPNLNLTLLPGRRYRLYNALTITGVERVTLEGPYSDNPNDVPVLECASAFPALILDAPEVRLANFRIQGCGGPALAFRGTSVAAISFADWKLRNITFEASKAPMAVYSVTSRAWIPFSATSLWAPELRGSLSLEGCVFRNGKGAFNSSFASPALGVSCPANCSVDVSDSEFSGNSGALVSSLLVQTRGTASLRVTRTLFTNNKASWAPLAAYYARTTVPAAAVLFLVNNGGDPGQASLEMKGATMLQGTGAHGLAAVRMPYANDDAQLLVDVSDTVLANFDSFPSPVLVIGSSQAVLSNLQVSRHTVPSVNASSYNIVNTTSTRVAFLSGGSSVCVQMLASPDSTVGLRNVTLLQNTVTTNGALYVTNVQRVLSFNTTPLGSFTAEDLRVLDQRSSLLGSGMLIRSLASVQITAGLFRNNTGLGGLGVADVTSLQLTNVTFVGNIRSNITDTLGTPQPATGRGGGLIVSSVANAVLDTVTFTRNAAVSSGGAALLENIDTLKLLRVVASGNRMTGTAVHGSDGLSGGAIALVNVLNPVLQNCTFTSNSAEGQGGALSVMGMASFSAQNTTFEGNVATGSGGAVYMTQSGTQVLDLKDCGFLSNTALTAVNASAASSSKVSTLSTAGGGAFYGVDVQAGVRFERCSFTANTAPFGAGGAISMRSSAFLIFTLGLLNDNSAAAAAGAVYLSNMGLLTASYISQSRLLNNRAGYPVPATVGSSAGGAVFVETSSLTVQCCELRGNVARKGGAIFAWLQARVDLVGDEASDTVCQPLLTLHNVPRATAASGTAPWEAAAPTGATATANTTNYGMIIADNIATAGGAVYIQDSTLQVQVGDIYPPWVDGVLFLNNSAVTGGALVAHTAVRVTLLADFYNNTATADAAAAVAAALQLPNDATGSMLDAPGTGGALALRGSEVTSVSVLRAAFVGNEAVDGGAVHVSASESCAQPEGCYAVTLRGCVMANNTARGGGGGGVFWEHAGILQLSCAAYEAPQALPSLSTSNSSSPSYPSGPPNIPLAPLPPLGPADLNSPIGLEQAGAPHPPSPLSPPPPYYHRAPPVVVPDASLRACDSWSGNEAVEGGYGGDIASTGFSLHADPQYLDFYTSSAPIATNLSVRDYYGQLCSGGNRSVVIRAVSLQAFGQTYMVSARGTAAFTDLKLRAQVGWHDIDFAASTAFRELSTSGMTVYVRPCVIGEYLSPALDQCLQCSSGYYNFDHTANLCRGCGPNALCTDPVFPGMILPEDGFWHSNLFSEQVVGCPNSQACTYPNRTALLSATQQRVKALSRAIQAALVRRPGAPRTNTTTSPPAATVADRVLLQARFRTLRRRAAEVLGLLGPDQDGAGYTEVDGAAEIGLWEGRAGALLRGGGGGGRRVLAELRRQMDELVEATGESPYGLFFDDANYSLLLQSVGTLQVNYSGSLCSPGYQGVLCGSCAPGYGSTGPATCRLCPNEAINAVYYTLAMLLTLVILGWTIRSLLTQSLLAAHQARGERKSEVMSEMRLMGRPLVHPSLIAVLDEDELPEQVVPQQPFYGAALPPTLEGLQALRAAFQQQQMEIEQSISAMQYHHRLQQLQQQQQQQQMEGQRSTSSRVRAWSFRRLPATVVPAPGSQGGAAPTYPVSFTHTASPARSTAGQLPLQPTTSLPFPLALLPAAAVTFADDPAALTQSPGILNTLASSPFASRPARAAPSLQEGPGATADSTTLANEQEGDVSAHAGSVGVGGTGASSGSGGNAKAEQGAVTVPSSPFVARELDAEGRVSDPEGLATSGKEMGGEGGGGSGPSQRSHTRLSGQQPQAPLAVWSRLSLQTSGEGGDDVDHDPRDSAQDRAGHSGPLAGARRTAAMAGPAATKPPPRRSQELLAAKFREGKIWPRQPQQQQQPPAAGLSPPPAPQYQRQPAGGAPLIRSLQGGATRRSLTAGSGPSRSSGATNNVVLDAVMRLRGRRSSASGYPDPCNGPLYDASSGGAVCGPDGGLLEPTRTASAATILKHPWFGAGSGPETSRHGHVHGSFPRRRTSAGDASQLRAALGAASSVTSMPPAFLAEVRRRQSRLDVLAGRRHHRGIFAGGNSRLGRSGDEAPDGPGVLRSEIEALRSGSASTVGSRMSVRGLGAVLRRRLGGGEQHSLGYGELSRMGSIDNNRAAPTGSYTSWFGGGGGGLRWQEQGVRVDEFSPPDEELGTPSMYGGGGGTQNPDGKAGGSYNAIGGGGGGDQDARPLQDAAAIKIFISYVQILALVKAVPIPSPPKSWLGYLRFYDQITAIPGSLVSLDCSLPDDLAVSKAMQRTILASLAPLYVSAGVAVVWTGLMVLAFREEARSHMFRRTSLGSFARQYLPPRLVMSFATIMYYFYPNTMKALLSIYSCVAVDVPTDNALAVAAGLHSGKYWTLDYSEECYVGQHLALALGLGMTGLLLMGVGWPVGVALWLYGKGREETLDFSDSSMVVYASYRELYRTSFLYWESVIMLRQMAVAVVVVLLAPKGVAVQMLVVIAVVAAAFVAQLLVQPFRTVTMNRLEEVALVVIMVTLYLNLYLLSPNVAFVGRTVLAVVIIGLNAAMLAVFVYYITRTSWEKQLDKMGLDRRRVYEMDPNEIRASLRRRYGPRTAELLTHLVTSAQTLKTAKSSLVQTGSLVSRQVAWSLRSSLKREEGDGFGDTGGAPMGGATPGVGEGEEGGGGKRQEQVSCKSSRQDSGKNGRSGTEVATPTAKKSPSPGRDPDAVAAAAISPTKSIVRAAAAEPSRGVDTAAASAAAGGLGGASREAEGPRVRIAKPSDPGLPMVAMQLEDGDAVERGSP